MKTSVAKSTSSSIWRRRGTISAFLINKEIEEEAIIIEDDADFAAEVFKKSKRMRSLPGFQPRPMTWRDSLVKAAAYSTSKILMYLKANRRYWRVSEVGAIVHGDDFEDEGENYNVESDDSGSEESEDGESFIEIVRVNSS